MRATGKLTRWLAASFAASAVLSSSLAVGAEVIWSERPSAEDIAAVLPETPVGTKSVSMQMRCKVAGDGRLSNCAIVSEEPSGSGYGPSVLSLAPKFRATPEAAAKMKGSVVIPIRFGPEPPSPPTRGLVFERSDTYRRLGDAGPYYPDRAARAGATAIVEADCRVVTNNQLKDCRIVTVTAPGYGFDDAFLKMAERGWLTAAPADASPADGVWRFRMVFDGQRH